MVQKSEASNYNRIQLQKTKKFQKMQPMTPNTFLTAAKIKPTLPLNLYGQSPLTAADYLQIQPVDATNTSATTVGLIQPLQRQSSAAIVTNTSIGTDRHKNPLLDWLEYDERTKHRTE